MTQGVEIFNIIDELGLLLQKKLIDINPTRTNSRWIFPTFPDSEDNFPEIVIELENIKYNAVSAGNYFKDFRDGELYKLYYYKEATADLIFYVLTSKTFSCNVIVGKEKRFLSNKLPNIYLSSSIKDLLHIERGLFTEFLEDIQLTGITSVYEDNTTTWTSEVQCKIRFKDVWVKELLDGQLIKHYNLYTYTN